MRMPGAGQRRRPRPIRLRVWGPIPCNGPIRWGSIPMDWPRRPAPRRDVPSPDCIPATQPIRSRRPAGGFARRRFRLRFADAWFAAGGFVAHGRFALRAGQPARLVGQGCRYADRCPAQGPAQGSGAQGQGRKEGRGSQNQEGAARFDSRQTQGEDHGQTAVAEGARGGASGRPAAEGCVEAQSPAGACRPQRER